MSLLFMKVSFINNSFISDLSTNSDTDNCCFISYFLFGMKESEGHRDQKNEIIKSEQQIRA